MRVYWRSGAVGVSRIRNPPQVESVGRTRSKRSLTGKGMDGVVKINEQWLSCEYDPDRLTREQADLILSLHKHPTWRPCLPQIAALAFLSEPASGDWE